MRKQFVGKTAEQQSSKMNAFMRKKNFYKFFLNRIFVDIKRNLAKSLVLFFFFFCTNLMGFIVQAKLNYKRIMYSWEMFSLVLLIVFKTNTCKLVIKHKDY